jgi:hypothetical protein
MLVWFIHATPCIHFDIAFAVNNTTEFIANPQPIH